MKLRNRKNRLKRLFIFITMFFLAYIIANASRSEATVVLYDKNGKYFESGTIIQIQYHYEDPRGGSVSDDLFFKRIRPHIAGSLYENWLGKIQIEFAKSDVSLMDVFAQYKGFDNMKIALGNHNFPFSREYLTPAKSQQLIERTFVGDGNYGVPYKNIGAHLIGDFAGKKITYGASIASASIDPDNSKLDFDTPVNRPGSNDDWNQGWIIGGRMDWHPLGYLKMEQGDFERKKLTSLGVAAYSWNNDDDNNISTGNDVASITGFEISGAFRGSGLSIDVEYNLFDAQLVDPNIDEGIYKNSESDLNNLALEGGYMIIPDKLEAVAGYQEQDADAYEKKWTRTSFGLNWFIKKNDIKLQATYRMGENLNGQEGNDKDELFVQAQFLF